MDGNPRHALMTVCAVILVGCAAGPADQPETVAAVSETVTTWLTALATVPGGTLTLRLRDGHWLIDDLAATLRTGNGGAFPPPTGFVPTPPSTTR